MKNVLRVGALEIALIQKAVKHVHLSVHPPEGQITLVVPAGTRREVARAYAISRLSWIRAKQARFASQAREPPRRFVGPQDLLEYVIVHEMMHLLEPTHSERFVALMQKYYPSWREARQELNELPR